MFKLQLSTSRVNKNWIGDTHMYIRQYIGSMPILM